MVETNLEIILEKISHINISLDTLNSRLEESLRNQEKIKDSFKNSIEEIKIDVEKFKSNASLLKSLFGILFGLICSLAVWQVRMNTTIDEGQDAKIDIIVHHENATDSKIILLEESIKDLKTELRSENRNINKHRRTNFNE